MNELGIERHAHTNAQKLKKKIANGEVIPFALGMAVTRAGHRQWRRAAGQGRRAPGDAAAAAAAGWPADLVRGAGGR